MTYLVCAGLIAPPPQARRESFSSHQDIKPFSYAATAPSFSQYYSPMGGASLSPGGQVGMAHAMTPPPSLSGMSSSLVLPGD